MDAAELKRLQEIQKGLDKSASEYRDRMGDWPPTPPGVDRNHPAVESLIPDDFDPYHGLGRDAWMESITNPDNSLKWADGTTHPEGFLSATDRHPVVLPVGEVIDRFGPPVGRFTSPPGVSYPERALPPTNLDNGYHQYEVIRPLPVWRGPIAPQMGEAGLGTQHYLPVSVQALIDGGYLREVPPTPLDNSAPGSSPDFSSSDDSRSGTDPRSQPQTHPFDDGHPGFSIMDENDRFYRYARELEPLPGHYDVIAHGTPNSVSMDTMDGRPMTPRELANLIRHRGDYVPGTPVRLLSCNTGHLDGNFATRLARCLNAPVVAPDGYLYINASGEMGVDRALRRTLHPSRVPDLPNSFHRFHPDGQVEEVGQFSDHTSASNGDNQGIPEVPSSAAQPKDEGGSEADGTHEEVAHVPEQSPKLNPQRNFGDPHPELTEDQKEALAERLRSLETEHADDFGELRRDPDKNGQINPSADDEARVCLDLREQGRLPEDVIRPTGADQGDFYSPSTGQSYDLKGVHSDWPPLNNHRDKSQPFKGAYNPDRNEKFVANMERQIVKGRIIVLDTRNANDAAIDDLKSIVESRGWSDNVIWYP